LRNYSPGYLWHWCIFDIASKEAEITQLEQKSARPDFWQEQSKAQQVMCQLAEKKKLVGEWRGLEQKVTDARELLTLAEEGTQLGVELESEVAEITARLDELELGLAFTDEYDDRDALLSIHAGAGACGYLRSEHGVHRLVRLSPFDADHARHTSFALVEVIPEAEGDVDVRIEPEDIKIDVFRSSGPGGQHMQKTSSAVRMTHLSSGLVVTCQSERSQFQNKEIALKILKSRLLELELEKRAEKRAKLKGKHVSAGWGNQIRSYVLHPYRMVKDHRTSYQTSRAEAVLEGELDGFITAYLRSRMGENVA
jgi:peptide chain release factor 2